MKKIVWALLDDRAGSTGQVRGITSVLDHSRYEVIEKKLNYNKLAALPNFIRGSSLLGVKKESRPQLKTDFPDIILSGSRRTAPIARWIKKQSRGKSKIVQLLYPGFWGRSDFDLIFIPEHDRGKISGANVHFTIGSPHRVTPENLKKAKQEWQKAFADLPRPLTAFIIGGNIKGKGFTLENARMLGEAVKRFHAQTGGSLLITDSHRTGAEAENLIMKIVKDIPKYNYLWGDKQPNPFLGYLAEAEYLVVTGDSVSMCCEACGTGKPVFVFEGESWLTPKHHRFVKSLFDSGHAVPLDEKNIGFKPTNSLNPAYDIAAEIDKI